MDAFHPHVAIRPPLCPGLNWCAELRDDPGPPWSFVYAPNDRAAIYRMLGWYPEARTLPFVGVK